MANLLISFGSKKERMPMVLIDCYVIGTIFLYFFGPVKFKSPYSAFMAVYLSIFLLVVNVAYFSAVWKKKRRGTLETEGCDIEKSMNPLPFWFYLLGFIIPLFMVVSSIIITDFSGLSGSLSNTMAQAYTFVQSGGRYQEGIDVPMWIYLHCAVFVYLTVADGLLFFQEIGLVRKIMWGGCLVLLASYFILFRGTQKTLGDLFVICASAILIKLCNSGKKRSKKGMFLLAVLIAGFAVTLATIMGGRIRYLNSIGYVAFKSHTKFWDVSVDSLFLSPFPEETKLGFASLVFYLCNGLCGLSFCLASPVTWTYGLGTFPDLSDVLRRRLGIDVYQNTYMYKAYETYGWHHSEQWHTLFPSLASDWTFVGALAIMGVAAYVYAVCWMEVLERKNKASIFMFIIMNIIWIYLPCNNQIFSTRTTTLIFAICFIIWVGRNKNVIRRRVKIKFRW